jgi:predicted permease
MPFPRLLDDFLRDLRHGLRVLARSPLFTMVAVCSLALGIGGAASVFTVLNAVVLRELPVANPQQLFEVLKVGTTQRNPRFGWPQFADARKELQGRAELAAFISTATMNVRLGTGTTSGPTERAMVQLVSGEFFQVLRQQAQAGRLFTPSDNEKLGAHPVAVISDAYWDKQFRRAKDAVGRTLVVNGATLTVIGVTQPSFYGAIVSTRNPEIWVPLMMQTDLRYASNASNNGDADPQKPWPPQRGMDWLAVIARVPQANDRAAVAAVLTGLYQVDSRSGSTPPDADALRRIQQLRVILEPAATGVSTFRQDLNSPLRVLLGMVAVLLAIACGNVASLLISRANTRDREMAIRLSIGAGRGRVVRQLLAEALLLAAVGGGLGLLIAAWGRDLLLSMFARGATVIDLDTSFDWRVLIFAIGITLLTGLAAGIGPALRGTRVSLAESLKSQGRTVGAEGGRRGVLIGKILVAAQIAFCLLLLVIAALFTRSMQSLLKIDVGFDREQILVARMDVRSTGYPASERQALYDRILSRLSSVPGVTSASLSMNGPLGTSQRTSSLSVEGYTPARDETLMTNEEVITDKYFETVGLEIVEGRGFGPEDRTPDARASIINESMARRFFPNGGAIGKRWDYGDAISATSARIVGIVKDAKYVDVRGASPNMIYRLSAGWPDDVLGNFEVRTSTPPAQLATTIKKLLAEGEPALPVFDIVPLDERLNRGLSTDRLVANLTRAFGGVALLLACLGLYQRAVARHP